MQNTLGQRQPLPPDALGEHLRAPTPYHRRTIHLPLKGHFGIPRTHPIGRHPSGSRQSRRPGERAHKVFLLYRPKGPRSVATGDSVSETYQGRHYR